LEINEARDYALVYQGEKRIGILDRRLRQNSLDVDMNSNQPLDILVENMGHVNFGPHLVDDAKGIVGKVVLAGDELKGWDTFTLPLDDLSKLKFSSAAKPGPSFYRATFNVTSVGDTFLDMRQWGKGLVWVNGHNLGRYWQIGPQQSLFVPSVWLRKGTNQITVLDLESGGDRSISGMKDPVYETRK
jgi:beta-galactosidase